MTENPFGAHLRAIRKKAHVTQQLMADMTGYDASLISRWERGKRPPPSQVDFFDSLLNVPRITEDDVALLASLQGQKLPLSRHLSMLSPMEGLDIHIFSSETFNSDLLAVIKAEINLSVKSVIERALEREQRLNK